MNYFIADDVPEYWDPIVHSFVTMSEWEVEFNNGKAVDCVKARVHKGLLALTYEGGSHINDAYARFARDISSRICFSCGVLATRVVFQYPKCDDCE